MLLHYYYYCASEEFQRCGKADLMDANITTGQVNPTPTGCWSEQLYIFQPWVQAVFVTLYVVIFVVGVAGNLAVVAVILCNKHMRTAVNIYILNLSASDILMALIMSADPHYVIYNRNHWIFGEVLCKLFRSSLDVSVYMSSFTLAAIAVDRYKAVFYPFSSQTKSLAGTTLIILCIDFVAIIISIPGAVIREVVPDELGNLQCKHTRGWTWDLYYDNITWNITQSVLPFTIIVFSYTRIVIRLHLRKDDLRRTESMTTQQKQEEAARTLRMNKMLISMVVIFGVCWFPVNLINMVNTFVTRVGCWNMYHLSFSITYVIAMSSTCYNPFLYGLLNTAFKAEFGKLYKWLLNTATTESQNFERHRCQDPGDETIEMETQTTN